MSYLIADAKEQLSVKIKSAIKDLQGKGVFPDADMPDFILEVPGDKTHGDWASNVAMVSAKLFKMPPVKIAENIKNSLDLEGTYFDSCSIAGPGFLNFFYKEDFHAKVLTDVINKNSEYGKSGFGKGEKVMVEFVSANPTGPMHMGNARGGALGDCLSAVLKTAGYDVYKEFYINDAGNQLDKFGMSLDIRYQQIINNSDKPELPEDAYHGDDIIEHAKSCVEKYSDTLMTLSEQDRRKKLVDYSLPKNISKMKKDMQAYGVEYDNWFHESSLHESGEVDSTIECFKSKGLTYEKDGALWYKATDFGAEKDEVLVRANGKPTYFTVDVAYHKNKFDRGFQRLIDCWGADHHGHVARMKTAMNAIGENGDKLDIVLYQMVNLMKDGQIVRMSKRTGKAIQLMDLLDEVSKDAARFTFNMHEPNISMDFDLGVAIKQNAENPVYYVQYAHARICSILKNLEADGIKFRVCTEDELMKLNSPEEIELTRYISIYTDEIIRSASLLDPSCITRYVIQLATLFHKFYNSCRVKGSEESLMYARIQLCMAVKIIIKNILDMFGIDIPDFM